MYCDIWEKAQIREQMLVPDLHVQVTQFKKYKFWNPKAR